MLYRISVAERGLTGIANIVRSRLSRLDDLLGAGTVPLILKSGLRCRYCIVFSGGSSIEADKALPHPQSPRSNTLQYFYLQYSEMRCIVKENNIFKPKNIFWFRNFEF